MRWNFEKFFNPDWWTTLFSNRRPLYRFFNKVLRITTASTRGFVEDDCASKASALTFYSLLSIVPVLAVAFGIAKGFGFEKHLEAELMQKFLEQREIVDKIIQFAYQMLQTTQGGLIAGVGLVMLFWTVLKLIGNIESSFNSIWKVHKPRTWARKFSDYLAMIIFCPIFFAASSSLSVFVVTQIVHYSQASGTWEAVSPFVTLAFHLFPLILAWMLFTAIYYIMPNTKVPLKYAFIAGVVAGTAYQVVQWAYIKFQLGLASYGAIYGSFAALPLFLIWLNTSWWIALAGAEIAYHAENDLAQKSLSNAPHQHPADARVLGLLIVQQCIEAFCQATPLPSVYSLSEKLGVSVIAIRRLLGQLIDHGIIIEVYLKDGTTGHYQPARDIKTITLKGVSDALDTARHEKYTIIYDEQAEKFDNALQALDNLLDSAKINFALDHIYTPSKELADGNR